MPLFRSETPPPPANLDFGQPPPSDEPTSAQLKADIDSGLTGDKAPHGDVGAAPLGTCEEAGGAAPSVRDLRIARRTAAAPPRVRSAADPHGQRWFVVPLFLSVTTAIGGAICLGLLYL
ncbi:hypothetical protein DK427_24195 [Methylobacterium radiodurans]|uniref:Uncharacterized protein n=2 Tax=Methylobacterium radiodurans TaxID=2202828 RepID=A0A2U8VYA9_9HYPH|nr:hypothetical protein DK427_24195 [Methylobacterium radiodurans]